MTKKNDEITIKSYSQKEIEEEMKKIESNPYFKKFKADHIPRCFVCGAKYKEIKKYIWQPNCPHIPKRFLLAVG